jgi:hypothetical protein
MQLARLVPGLLVLGALLGAAEPAAHLADPERMLPPDAAQSVGTRLTAFEETTGIRMLVQFHAKSPAAEEDKVPGAYMHALAARLGVAESGVLVVYFADDPDWRVWIGDALTARFAGKPGTVKELTDSGAIHDAKEALLASAREKAAAEFKYSPAPIPAQHLALQTGALIDALAGRLKP